MKGKEAPLCSSERCTIGFCKSKESGLDFDEPAIPLTILPSCHHAILPI